MCEEDLMFLFSTCGRNALKQVIEFHIIDGLVYWEDVIKDGGMKCNTLCGDEVLRLKVFGKGMIGVNDGEGRIFERDLIAENGCFHFVSEVLVPGVVVLPSMRDQPAK